MRITSSKKDEILKRKAEYEQKEAEYRRKENEYYRSRQEREENALKPAVDAIRAKMDEFDLLHIDVTGDRRWGGFQIRVQCDEYNRNEDATSLRWNYQATGDSDTGEVKKETGSWSGLQAVTELQIQSLKQSVAALEYLQSFDWEKYLTQDVSKLYEGLERPRYEDRPQGEDFDAELKAAELEEIVGTTKAIKVHNYEGSYYYGKYIYVLITKMTPKQVYVIDVPVSSVENAKIGNEESKANLKRFLNSGNTKRVAQDRLHLADPVDIVDIEELSK